VRKRSRAAVAEVEVSKAGVVGRVIGAHPREFVGVLLGGTATIIIVFNALFMQKGPHPAPIFAARPAAVAPASAPVVAQPTRVPAVQQLPPVAQPPAQPLNRVQTIAEIQRELARRGFYDGAADGIWGAKTDSGARDFAQAAGVRVDPNAPEELLRTLMASKASAPPAPQPARRDPIAELIAPSPRVVAIQRALSDFGYGQIKPTGTYDAPTRAAIEKFERDRKLPVTGQISDRFVRELAGMTGRPLE